MAELNRRDMVAGYFKDRGQAERTVEALRQAGFAQIGVASRRVQDAEHVADKTSAKSGVATTPDAHGELKQSAGTSIYASPGDLEAALQASNVQHAETSYFMGALDKKGMLVTVRTTGGRAQEAERILESGGADLGRNIPATAQPREASPTIAAGDTIQLQGELLNIHKERVQRGELRMHKEVVTERQRFDVPVSHEEVVVERGPATGRTPNEPIGSQREIRVPLTEEKVTVQKQPVVAEEVRLSKHEVSETQPVDETVQHEELKVEQEGKLSPEELKKLKEKQRRAA